MNDPTPGFADAPVTYHLRLRAPGTRTLEVSCRVRQPDPAGQVFSLPAWIPGSYLVRDFARHVVAIAAECDGAPVALRKTDKSTWQAAAVDGELVVRAEVYASDPSVRGANLDPGGAFVNGSCVFLRVHGAESARAVVHVSPGDDAATPAWQVATALERLTGSAWEYGAFAAAGYEELIDHPLLLGPLAIAEFTVAGTPHALVLAGRHDADLPRIATDLARACEWHVGFFGRPAPMARYLFLVRLTGEGFGGLEHRASTALVCHRNALPRPGQGATGREYRTFLGLASHEYFHLWHVKRIRPAELTPYALASENYTRQLWLFEGVTSYYDDLCLARTGLVTAEAYLELLGRMLTSVYRTPGRRRQTLEEASFDAWIKFYRPDENTPNATVSYYAKGAMIALALDLEIRLRTQGRVSLDDVMRVLWATYGREGRPLPEGAFEELAMEVSGCDLGEFFRNALRSSVDPPVGILLAQFGVRLQMRAADSAGDAGGTPGARQAKPRPWLGIRTRGAGGRVRVTHVLDDGPAQRAGVCAEDEVIAVGGLRAEGDGVDGLLDRLPAGSPVELHVFRRDELLCLVVTPTEPPRDTCFLVLDPAATPAALERRRQWLPTAGG